MAASLLLIFLAAASPPPASTVRTTPQKAAKRVAECGLGPVTTRVDPDSGEDVIVATSAKSATDAQLSCADKAAGFYTLELTQDLQRRFDAPQEARVRPIMQARARAWLAAHGLLPRVPAYRKGVTDDAAFTRRIETLCGPKAKGAFESKYGFHALSPDWIKRELNPPSAASDVFTCLIDVTMAAGYEVGFIGNEYYSR